MFLKLNSSEQILQQHFNIRPGFPTFESFSPFTGLVTCDSEKIFTITDRQV